MFFNTASATSYKEYRVKVRPTCTGWMAVIKLGRRHCHTVHGVSDTAAWQAACAWIDTTPPEQAFPHEERPIDAWLDADYEARTELAD